MSFVYKALMASMLFSCVAGSLGSFMLWRRLPFIADTIAHAGLLGVACSVGCGVSPMLGMLFVSVVIACLLTTDSKIVMDVRLAVLANGMLALGLVSMSLLGRFRMDLLGLLFGDVLSVSTQELWGLFLMVCVVSGGLIYRWHDLLATVVSSDLASVHGIRVARTERLLVIVVALVVAFAARIFGVMLVSGLLVIPAACARMIAKSPESMVGWAVVLGAASSASGIRLSMSWDVPTSPAIILSLSSIYICLSLMQYRIIHNSGG